MRKILHNRRRNIELNVFLEKKWKEPGSSFVSNVSLAALIIFVIHYIFHIPYLEVLGFILALLATFQRWKDLWKSDWIEEWFLEWFDKWSN